MSAGCVYAPLSKTKLVMQKNILARKLPFLSLLGKGLGDGVEKRRFLFSLLACTYFCVFVAKNRFDAIALERKASELD